MTRVLTALVLLFTFASPAKCESKAKRLLNADVSEAKVTPPAGSDLSDAEVLSRLEALQANVEQLEAELEVLKAESRLMIHKATLGYLDGTYAKAGFSIIFPRRETLPFAAYGYGLGAFAGVGHYIGRNHVFDLEIASDAQMAATLRYRFEIHPNSPAFAFGPTVGYRVRLAKSLLPTDFLASPQQVAPNFILLGAMAGLPIGHSLGVVEFSYLFNHQAFLFANVGFNFFF